MQLFCIMEDYQQPIQYMHAKASSHSKWRGNI